MFRGRGASPSIGGTTRGGSSGGTNNSSTVSHHHPYIHYWHHMPYYYYDKNFLIMEMAVVLLVIIVCITTFIAAYEPSFLDPIGVVKKIYINSQLIVILISAILVGIFSFLARTKKGLIKALTIILIGSVIAIIIFLGIKLVFDNTYTATKFSELYEISDVKKEENATKKYNISGGLGDIRLKSVEERYIKENLTAYEIFSLRTVFCTGLYGMVIVFNIFMIIRLLKRHEKRDRLDKDDEVLYDEEENVKI